jgi:hypothetical protein
LICAIAERTPGVEHWLPTREAGTVRQYVANGGHIPNNLTVRLSIPRINGRVAPAFHKLAEHPRVRLSGVHATDTPEPGFTCCPAYQNDGACGDCRACWDPSVDVSYPLH